MDDAVEQTVRAELVRQKDEARRSIQRGVIVIALVPCIVIACAVAGLLLGGFPALLAVLLSAVYTVVGGIAGAASIIAGAAEHRRFARQLRELDEVRGLPVARLLR